MAGAQGKLLKADLETNFAAEIGDAVEIHQVAITQPPTTEDTLGPDTLVNGDFSDGTAGWSPQNAAVFSVTNRIATVEHGGTNNPYILQQVGSGISGTKFAKVIEARSTGGTAFPRGTVGGATIFTGTNSTEWQRFDLPFVAAGDFLALYSDTDVLGESCEYRCVSIRETTTVPNGNKKMALDVEDNLVLQSEDVTISWTNTACVDGNPDEIIGTAVLTVHSRDQIVTGLTEGMEYTFSHKWKKGAQPYIRFVVSNSTFSTVYTQVFINAATGEIVNVDDGSAVVTPLPADDDYDFEVHTTFVAETTARAYLFPSGGTTQASSSYTGDGSTVDLYVSEMHLRPGNVATGGRYVKTTTAPITRQLWEAQPDVAKMHAAGYLLVAGTTNDWRQPVYGDGVEYISPNQSGGQSTYRRHFAGTTATGTDTTLVSGLAPMDIPVTSGGGVDDGTGNVLAVGHSNRAATQRIGMVAVTNSRADLVLPHSSTYDGKAYKVWADYTKQ